MLKTLSDIGNTVKQKEITWGIGGSLLLKFYNLIDNPNDIDILVAEKDALPLNEMLKQIGNPQKVIHKKPFCTAHFFKYRIYNSDIDVMGGFGIQHNKGIFQLRFEEDSIVAHREINGVDIPLCALEDWYILYNLIPNKQEKTVLIEKYFQTNGIKYPDLLERALAQPLPSEVRVKVIKLLNLAYRKA